MRTGNATSNFHRCTHLLTKPLCLTTRRAGAVRPVLFCPINTAAAYRRYCARRVLRFCFMIPRAIPLLHFIEHKTVDFFFIYYLFFFYFPRRYRGYDCLERQVIRSSIITCEIVFCDKSFLAYSVKRLSFNKNHLTRKNISDACENCKELTSVLDFQ